jgi:hypothetical protein
MIDDVLYSHIKNNLGVSSLRYGSAEGSSYPFYVMTKIDDMERPETLCNDQGETGRALFIFDGYVGGQANAGSSANAVTFTETLKNIVKGIRGVIGTAPNDYRIWYNETRGVTLKDYSSPNQLTMFGAEFQCIIWWDKL